MHMSPQALIQLISHIIDQAELSRDPYQFIHARRLLNNELPQAIDEYVAEAVRQATKEVQNAALLEMAVGAG